MGIKLTSPTVDRTVDTQERKRFAQRKPQRLLLSALVVWSVRYCELGA